MYQSLLLGLTRFFLVIFVYASVVRTLLSSLVDLPNIPGSLNGQTLVLVLFSLTHACYALGWRHTLLFFGLSAVISWTFEQLGVATGWVYGPYHYTEVLGIKLGHVPLLIPMAWFMMIYPSYVIANLLVGDPPVGSHGSPRRIIWLSFLSALVMTAWDLVVDPVLSGAPIRAWVWEQGGPYFGVPLQNFAGWILTTFTVYVLYRLFEQQVEIQPVGPLKKGLVWMPLVAYGSLMIVNSFGSSETEALRVIGPFIMGFPLLVAATRLLWNCNGLPNNNDRQIPCVESSNSNNMIQKKWNITKIAAIHRASIDLESERAFLADMLDFQEVGFSSNDYEKSIIFRAGECTIISTSPIIETSDSALYLKRHPTGISCISFYVENIEKCYSDIIEFGGIITKPLETKKCFCIATPIDSVQFQFIDIRHPLFSSDDFICWTEKKDLKGGNYFGFQEIDHITCNFSIIHPAVFWFEQVLKFDKFWNFEMHTNSISQSNKGTGLKSIVMYDRDSGIKFALNEPKYPNIHGSQISQFVLNNNGSGIQHIALSSNDMIQSISRMRSRSIPFLDVHDSYYDMIKASIDFESLALKLNYEDIRNLGIQIDMKDDGSFLLQAFMKSFFDIPSINNNSLFFFEIIQRVRCESFGEGNFYTLFKAMEDVAEQKTENI